MNIKDFSMSLGITEEQAQEKIKDYKLNPVFPKRVMTVEEILEFIFATNNLKNSLKIGMTNIAYDRYVKEYQKQGYSLEDAQELVDLSRKVNDRRKEIDKNYKK